MAITAKELIAKKTDITARKAGLVEIEVRDIGTFTFKAPSTADFVDAAEYSRTHGGADSSALTTVYMIYSLCEAPDLHDVDLQKAYGAHGHDIVTALFKPGEIAQISDILSEAAGFGEGAGDAVYKVTSKLKN